MIDPTIVDASSDAVRHLRAVRLGDVVDGLKALMDAFHQADEEGAYELEVAHVELSTALANAIEEEVADPRKKLFIMGAVGLDMVFGFISTLEHAEFSRKIEKFGTDDE